MSNEATVTFRVEEHLKREFSERAKANDVTPAQLFRRFMRDYVRPKAERQEDEDYDVWFRRQVRIGLDAAEAGRLIPGELVEAKATAWREETQRQLVAGQQASTLSR
jgi:predicted transcriptional regulator